MADQLIDILLFHRPLVGQAGSQAAGGEGADRAGIAVLHFGGREKGLLLRLGRNVLFAVVVYPYSN